MNKKNDERGTNEKNEKVEMIASFDLLAFVRPLTSGDVIGPGIYSPAALRVIQKKKYEKSAKSFRYSIALFSFGADFSMASMFIYTYTLNG